jgi:hypothetical protein
MDSTSPQTTRTAGDQPTLAPTVPKFLLGLVIRCTLWLGHAAARSGYRRPDQTPTPTLAP